MTNPVGSVLRQVGLYKPFHRGIQYLTDPVFRQREIELRQDLERTRRQVGGWAAQGAEYADPKRLFAIVSFTNLPMHAKFHCLAAKAMQLRGYTPVIFTHSGSRFAHEYFRMFGINRLVMWNQLAEQYSELAAEAQRIVQTFALTQPSVTQVKNIEFRGVCVGKHALSMTCRKRVEGRLDLTNPATFALLQEQLTLAVQSALLAERFLDENPVEKMLVRDSGYTPNGAIFETALHRGTDCVVFEFGQRRSAWVFKRFTPETKGQHYFSLSASTWDVVKNRPWTKREDEKLEREFAGRYQPDSTDDTRRLQAGKVVKSPAEVRKQLELDPNKKTAVIFSHIAWDAAFFYGEGLFEDFEDWLFQTVQFVARECSHLNWIIKEHPFNVFKLQRESVKETSERRLLQPLMPLPKHVRFMPADTDINTQSLFPLVDYVLTVNGTVGMEFPCFGIPAIVAGTGRYTGYGFTIEPPSQAAYFETLRNLQTIPRLNAAQRELARRHLYALQLGKQISFQDSAPMELKRLHEAQSDVHDNIHFAARSLQEFQASRSVKLLGDWLAYRSEPDLYMPDENEDQDLPFRSQQ